MIITTSWDDGHVLDIKLADMLDRHGLTGTFYIARQYLDERMTDTQLRDLSQRHELGAHTLNHPTLTEIDDNTAHEEIIGSKAWLEDIISKPVTSFCYPKGMFTVTHRDMVQEAGFTVARTVAPYKFSAEGDPFQMPTTVHIYPFPLRPIKGLRGIRTRLQPIRKFMPHRSRVNIPLTALTSWTALAKALLDEAQQQNGIWHLWGHSWEIEKFDMWSQLDDILAIASTYPAQTNTNTEIIKS
jgi:peptidoglycan-N-acetylglucosamine deacetylase